MLPTPITSHIDPTTIYAPAEDSYLFLDTLSSTPETTFLAHRFPTSSSSSSSSSAPPLILEIGSGSGIITSFLCTHGARIFGRRDAVSLCTDANALASRATVDTVARNLGAGEGGGVFLSAVTADLAAPVRPGLVDVLVFNPPYVPTPEVPGLEAAAAGGWEEEVRLLALTYAGGAEGMEVTAKVLRELEALLSERGVAYVLLSSQNRPEAAVEGLRARGWLVERVGSSGSTGGIEKLGIWRIWKD